MTDDTNATQYRENTFRKDSKKWKVIELMKKHHAKPMAAVVDIIMKSIDVPESQARAYYFRMMQENYAPGDESGRRRKWGPRIRRPKSQAPLTSQSPLPVPTTASAYVAPKSHPASAVATELAKAGMGFDQSILKNAKELIFLRVLN